MERCSIERFVPDGCMCESNFQVDKFSHSYGAMCNAINGLSEGRSVSERAAMFRDTRCACMLDRRVASQDSRLPYLHLR